MQDIRCLVGNRIRTLRKEAHMSQEMLGLKSGLDRTYIASVEAGKRNISIVNLEKLSLSLGYSVKDFFSSNEFEASVERYAEVASKSEEKYDVKNKTKKK